MKRRVKSDLVLFPPEMKGHSMRQDARRVFNRITPRNQDWFRVQNKAGSDTTEVFIYDEIGFWGTEAADFCAQLRDITTPNIDLHLNTPGGDVFDGVAIYNALKQHDAYVTTYIDSLAASAGSFIAQAGDRIVMMRNATMMIHDASAFCWGNAADMESTAKILNKISDNIADIYAFNAGGTVEEFRALMKEETWYLASEAVDSGLAHEMLDEVDEEAEKAKNNWDLSIFNYAGRDKAPAPKEVRVLISNRIKEASMGKPAPKNQGETPPEENPPADPAEETPEEEPEATPAEPVPATPESPAAPGADPATPANRSGFKINNSLTTDAVQVQNHIDSLELFRKETLENARKSFVQQLAKDKKIAATQIDDLEEFALDLSDKQYEKWTASWDAVGSISMLGSHSGGAPASTEEKATSDEVQMYKDIVRQHKLGSMPVDKIMKTDSYKRLLALEPDFKL